MERQGQLLAQSLSSDDFSWPFPQRGDTMYLSTIGNLASKPPPRHLKSLQTEDIEGAFFVNQSLKYLKKEHFVNRTNDIFRPFRNDRSPHKNKPDLQLAVADIEGARPSLPFAKHFKRHTDPLAPVYSLPAITLCQPYEPRFLRDSMAIDDIEGAKAKNILSKPLRQIPPPIDPKSRRKYKKEPLGLDVRDINYPNPELDPRSEKSKKQRTPPPAQSPARPIRPKQNLCLQIKDIEGASSSIPGSKIQTVKELSSLKPRVVVARSGFGEESIYEQTFNYKPAVEGAKAGSLKKGISTKRMTDPLVPRYNFPGGGLSNVNRLDRFIS